MSHRLLRVVAFAALLVSCGGDAETGVALAVSTSKLSIALASVRIDLHTGDRACTEILQSGADVLGSYVAEVDVAALGANEKGQGEINGIVPQTYTLALWGFAAGGLPAAFACAPDVVIERGKRRRVSVELSAL
jgi:hypothetical protein